MHKRVKQVVLTLALVALPVTASAQTDDTATTEADTAPTVTMENQDRDPGFPWGLLGLLGLAGLAGRRAQQRTEVRLTGPTDGPRRS